METKGRANMKPRGANMKPRSAHMGSCLKGCSLAGQQNPKLPPLVCSCPGEPRTTQEATTARRHGSQGTQMSRLPAARAEHQTGGRSNFCCPAGGSTRTPLKAAPHMGQHEAPGSQHEAPVGPDPKTSLSCRSFTFDVRSQKKDFACTFVCEIAISGYITL